MSKLDTYERVEIDSRDSLRAWLTNHHQQSASIWVVTYKKHCGPKHVPWPEVVDEALCFGWVDSVPRKLNADQSMVLLSPRKVKSGWSAINKAKVERLVAEGRMMPAGLAKIELAKANGSWSLLDGVDQLVRPPDLVAALAMFADAAAFFDGFPRSAQRGILEWIVQAKTPATREKRIQETAQLAQVNIRANQFRQKQT